MSYRNVDIIDKHGEKFPNGRKHRRSVSAVVQALHVRYSRALVSHTDQSSVRRPDNGHVDSAISRQLIVNFHYGTCPDCYAMCPLQPRVDGIVAVILSVPLLSRSCC
jgi:hypothetical protein